MEAASQKLPILSTPVSAIPEFITTHVHGILAGDAPAAIADEMCKVAGDPSLGPRLADAAFERLTSEFLMHPGIAHLKARLNEMLAQGIQ
jgi:glycosyltransferase involved in cell wall biosynthesis